MRVAVIGAGISGLVAAYRLQQKHQVVLFEASSRIGGHTNTVDVFEGNRPVAIDTGFIVFNTKTYPNFVKLMGELGISWAESRMSFSVRSERRNFEYNPSTVSGLFSQRKRVLSPRFWRMALDITRFFREGQTLLGAGPEISVMDWLQRNDYSQEFVEDHFLPLLQAIWSTNREVAEVFPARFLVRFFQNHGLLQLSNRQPWITIPGGARNYVRAMLCRFSGEVRADSPIQCVRRENRGVSVRVEGLEAETFDHVVVACHSDQALRLLTNPTRQEQALLGAIRYQPNEAVLHTDWRLMPKHRRVWASWNAHLDDAHVNGACLTYWMNNLQPLGAQRNYFVTLNNTRRIQPGTIIKTFQYAHPLFSMEALKAQARHDELICHHGISYCGAYWGNGFHEDGVVSALRIVAKLADAERAEVAA